MPATEYEIIMSADTAARLAAACTAFAKQPNLPADERDEYTLLASMLTDLDPSCINNFEA